MNSLWNDEHAATFHGDSLALRAYSSRLLGADSDLVLHGGGNTSVKLDVPNLFGEPEEILFVKGSGWDLASIEPAGFAPLRLAEVRRLTDLESLSDAMMMRALAAATTDADAPAPSVETITHAIIPHRFVDHTHADALVTLTNTPDGEAIARDLYGDDVIVIPYAMPGFVLARLIDDRTRGVDWSQLLGLVLLNHGLFTFADDARESYERMIELVSRAEQRLGPAPQRGGPVAPLAGADLETLAALRGAASKRAGTPFTARVDCSEEVRTFSEREGAADLAARGCLTPDHVIHVKPFPLWLASDSQADDAVAAEDAFADRYTAHVNQLREEHHVALDPAPRWVLWEGRGTVSFGTGVARARVVSDIAAHTLRAADLAERHGGWQPLSGKQLFDVEYWELEQVKLRRAAAPRPLQGRVAIVTGAASGIGAACAQELLDQGAAVTWLDIHPDVGERSGGSSLGIQCDVTSSDAVRAAVDATVAEFGGIDIVVSNAGTFPPGMPIDRIDDDTWQRALDINLNGHMRVIRSATRYLRHGLEPSVIVIGSKNVPAPGPGAAAYSAAKAALTQLARVAALELGTHGIRVNVIHPNAVFDTGIWTDDVIEARASSYGLSAEEYRANNVLGVAVRSTDVAAMAAAMAGPVFARTTGAQVPVDGGNDRVI